MPWLREREGQVWTSDDTERVERTVAEVEATWQRILRDVKQQVSRALEAA